MCNEVTVGEHCRKSIKASSMITALWPATLPAPSSAELATLSSATNLRASRLMVKLIVRHSEAEADSEADYG